MKRTRVYSSQWGNKRTSGGGTATARPRRGGTYIDPARFINKNPTAPTVLDFTPKHRFSDFAMPDFVHRNIASHGYTVPTPIQDAAIPAVLEGRDLVGLANTGTGKTAAFLLPIIQRLMTSSTPTAGLVIAPTRELAVQIQQEFRIFTAGSRLQSALCVGGMNMERQISALRRQPQLVVGTPGRLKDLLNQRALRLDTTHVLVLDEFDRMLDMGFITDIRALVSQLPARRQSLCFSATVSPDIQRLLPEFLKDPVTISVVSGGTSDHVEQDVIRAQGRDQKLEVLAEILRRPDADKVLVFCQTKWGAQKLANSLSQLGLSADAIHGDKSQSQRQRALDAFKHNRVRILVATDVAARGIDVPQVSHVINFDQPATYDDYVHRIGRTGRAGKTGQALTFV